MQQIKQKTTQTSLGPKCSESNKKLPKLAQDTPSANCLRSEFLNGDHPAFSNSRGRTVQAQLCLLHNELSFFGRWLELQCWGVGSSAPSTLPLSSLHKSTAESISTFRSLPTFSYSAHSWTIWNKVLPSWTAMAWCFEIVSEIACISIEKGGWDLLWWNYSASNWSALCWYSSKWYETSLGPKLSKPNKNDPN